MHIGIETGSQRVADEIYHKDINLSKVSAMVNVDSISELIETAKKADIELAVGPRHYYWGTIEVVIKDPDGFVLVFIGPYSKEEAKRVNADETWGKPPRK